MLLDNDAGKKREERDPMMSFHALGATGRKKNSPGKSDELRIL